MKTFNGKSIIPPTPATPRKNQVWKNANSQEIFKVISIMDKLQAMCETEKGDRFMLGFGWFDNKSYIYLGYLL